MNIEQLAQAEEQLPPEGYINPKYITGCKEPAQQEPVAWIVTTEMQDGDRGTFAMMGRLKDVIDCCDFGTPVPLYATPQPAPVQEQPAREFVWLTNEEIAELKNLPGANRERTATEMAFAVRDKLMEKNT